MIIQQKSAFVNKKSRNQQKILDDCADRTYNSPRSTKIEHQTEGGNTMAKAKRYTAEQLSDAEKMAATLANVPEEKFCSPDSKKVEVRIAKKWKSGWQDSCCPERQKVRD